MSENAILKRAECPPKSRLKPGSHTISINQTVQLDGGLEVSESIYEQEVIIDVRLERFQPPGVIFRYPQPGSQPVFESILPHIVLASATLPWERSAGEGATSWVALVAFVQRPIEVISGTVANLQTLKDSEEAIRLPKLTVEEWESDRSCRYIDITLEEFKTAVPMLSELDKLAHVQETAAPRPKTAEELPEGKKSDDRSAASVVLSKRAIERILGDADHGKPIQMHLVSLEGHGTLMQGLEGGTVVMEGMVRLHTLDNWNFTLGKAPGAAASDSDFLRICNALSPRNLNGDPAATDMLLRDGYVRFEGGGQPLYYQGPLVSGPIYERTLSGGMTGERVWEEPEDCLFQIETAGGQTGIDISFAAAWQMGRLVAMGDPNLGELFSRVRSNWQYLSAIRARDIAQDWGDETDEVEINKLFGIAEDDRQAGVRLSRLWLLEKVPLHYLLPDPSRLPPESICPVFLDHLWADAWCWGAFSAGSHSPRDFNLGYRDGQQLFSSEGLLDWHNHDIAGLLIRSRLVSDWPTLEIGFSLDGEALPAESILRREKIAPDILLVLVNGRYTSATLKLPSECLHFRTNESSEIQLRSSAVETAAHHTHTEPRVKFQFQ